MAFGIERNRNEEYVVVYQKSDVFANAQLVEWTEGSEFTEEQIRGRLGSLQMYRVTRKFMESYNTAMRAAELAYHELKQTPPIEIERVIRFKIKEPEPANA